MAQGETTHNPNLFQRILQTIFDPKYFFSNLQHEHGITTAFRFYAILLLFSTILISISSYLFLPIYYNLFFYFIKSIGVSLQNIPITAPTYDLSSILISSLFSYPFVLGFSFIVAIILHLYCKIFGAKAQFSKTYQLYVYSNVPNLVFSWLPFINFFIWIYVLALLIIGTEHIYKFTKQKSMLIYLIPLSMFALLAFFIITVLIIQLTRFSTA